MERKGLVLERITRPNKYSFNRDEIVLLYIEKKSNHCYDIRGGIVINSFSYRGKEEALELKVLQIVTKKDQPSYSTPKLPFIRNYPYSLIKKTEKFVNLDNLSKQVLLLSKLMG